MGIFDRLFKTWEPEKSKEEIFSKAAIDVEAKIKEFEESRIFKEEKEKGRFLENSTLRKVINTTYNSQRDNKHSPRTSCNVTSIQMALSIDYPSITDDELFLLCNSQEMMRKIKFKYPKDYNKWIYPQFFRRNCANEVFVVLLEAIHITLDSEKYAKIEWNLNTQKIIDEIDRGYPFVMCGKFPGVGGHFTCISGYDLAKKVWIIDDPWGDWNTRYKDHYGEKVEYSMDKVKKFMYSYGIKIHSDRKVRV